MHQFIPICQFSFGRKRVLSVCVFTYSTKKFILSYHLHGACQFLPSTTVLASNNGFRIFPYLAFLDKWRWFWTMPFKKSLSSPKGGFYPEGTDTFVISSNRWILLFSWAWILNLRYFRCLKSCHIRAWVSSKGSNSKMKPYLSLQSHFRHLYDIIWVL